MGTTRKRKTRIQKHLPEAFLDFFAIGVYFKTQDGNEDLDGILEAEDYLDLGKLYRAHYDEVLQHLEEHRQRGVGQGRPSFELATMWDPKGTLNAWIREHAAGAA